MDESRVSAATYWDTLYAIVMDAPIDALDRMQGHLTIQSARLRPDRDTWGMLPDQVALSNKITKMDQPGATAPRRRRGGGPGFQP